MSDVKAIVRRFDRYSKTIRGEWYAEFIDDLVRNEGKIVTLYDYECNEYEISYKLRAENGILWHQHGKGEGFGNWSSNDAPGTTELIFHIYKAVELDEDLFTI